MFIHIVVCFVYVIACQLFPLIFFSVVDLVAANFLTNSGEIWLYHYMALQWRHNDHDGVSNHQPRDCLLNRLFRCRSKKTLKLRVTGLCVGNSSVTVEFPAQRASNAENVSIWWRHHEKVLRIISSWWGEHTARRWISHEKARNTIMFSCC